MMRAVAVGRFDGVHLGHRHLLAETRRRTPDHTLVAYTFPPRGPSLLTLDAKVQLLQSLADEVWIARWEEIQHMTAEAFVREELWQRLGATAVAVGPDHRFGRGRTGDLATLRRLASSLPMAVHTIPPLELDGAVVSAARIRALVSAGDVEQAARLLGRPAWLAGTPIPGVRLARRLGYPTVNLDLAPELVRPRSGVYAAWAQWSGGESRALFYIGRRLTFTGLPPSAEVHLFAPPPHPVAGPVEVHLIRWIRPDQRFPDAQALVAQIARDRVQAEEVLSTIAAPPRLLRSTELRTPGAGA